MNELGHLLAVLRIEDPEDAILTAHREAAAVWAPGDSAESARLRSEPEKAIPVAATAKLAATLS